MGTVTAPTAFKDHVDAVRLASEITAVISERIPVTAGFAVCPFHPDTRPSLNVNKERQFFHCFGCKTSGDVFRFLELLDGCTFREAVETLAKRAGLPVYKVSPQEADLALTERQVAEAVEWFARYYEQRLTPAARDYITEARGLPASFVTQYRIGWSDGAACGTLLSHAGESWRPIVKAAGLSIDRAEGSWSTQAVDLLRDRVIFPNIVRAQATFLSGRTLDPAVEPKYLHQRGLEAPLYNEEALNPDFVIAVEGQVDALSLCAWRYPAVGCTGGVKAKHLPRLKRPRRVYACFDGDHSGALSTLKLGEALGGKLRVIALPPGQDPNDLYRTETREHFELLREGAKDPVTWALSLVPPDVDPVDHAAALEPVFRLLAHRPVAEQEILWGHVVAPTLKLSRAASDRVRRSLVDYADVARAACSHCGASILTPRRTA